MFATPVTLRLFMTVRLPFACFFYPKHFAVLRVCALLLGIKACQCEFLSALLATKDYPLCTCLCVCVRPAA